MHRPFLLAYIVTLGALIDIVAAVEPKGGDCSQEHKRTHVVPVAELDVDDFFFCKDETAAQERILQHMVSLISEEHLPPPHHTKNVSKKVTKKNRARKALKLLPSIPEHAPYEEEEQVVDIFEDEFSSEEDSRS